MRRSRSIAVALALVPAFALAGGCRSQPVRDARIVENPSVVTIVGWKGTKGGGGTGFFVAPDAVVTCRHVVVGKQDVFVRLADSRQIPVKGVWAESKEHDLILLAVDPVRGAPPLALASAEPGPGASLTAIGSPELRAQTVAPAEVSGEERIHAGFGLVMEVRCDMGPGASGAPLLDADGRVVGVISGMAAYGTDFLVVPARFVSGLSRGALQPMQAWGAATAADPTLAVREAFNGAGQDYWRKDYARALKECERLLPEALAVKDLPADVCEMIGRCCVALGRPDDGVARLQRIVAEHPNEAWSHASLAGHFERLDRKEEAVSSFREASRLDPQNPYHHFRLARLLVELDRPAEAEPEARIALARWPESASALHTLGVILANQKKYAEALPFLDKVARKWPRDAKSQADLARLHMVLGQNREAIASYEDAVRLDPDDAEAYGDLAILYRGSGDVEKSRRDLEVVRRLHPTWLPDLERRLAGPPAVTGSASAARTPPSTPPTESPTAPR